MSNGCKTKGLSSFALSLIAAISMTFDHAAVALVSQTPIYYIMRAVGRISFVIFAFLISQSVKKTSSIKRFCTRLLIFAIISEPFFDMTFYHSWVYFGHQNIFFTLLAGVVCCTVIKRKDAVSAAAAAGIVFLAQIACFDYGGAGVLLITAFYLLDKKHTAAVVALFAAAFMADNGAPFDIFAFAAVPIIELYNGSRGGNFMPQVRKWLFYVYYPAHIMILMALMHNVILRFA